jgi:type VI secretion system secreted protein Hcp
MADIFLKLDGIDGESQDDVHRDEIEVTGWSWDMVNNGPHMGSPGGPGKATFRDLEFNHAIDRASPNLMQYLATGKPIATAVLTMRKAGGVPLDYLRITLSEVRVTQVETRAIGGANVEHVRLSFTKVKQEYTLQNAKGGTKGTVTGQFDLRRNAAC